MNASRQTQSGEQLERSAHPLDAFRSQALSGPRIIDRSVRRWATVRFILGFLQMFGAAFSLGVFVVNGITALLLGAVLITGIFTTLSILLFQVWKRGGTLSRSRGEDHS